MDTAVNFYELKNQLADLGYASPELVNHLRLDMAEGTDEFRLPYEERTGDGILNCSFDLRRPEPGLPIILQNYDTAFRRHDSEESSYRSFSAEVNKNDACKVLAQALHNGDTLDDLPWVMGAAEVKQELERYIPRELDTAKLDELDRQLQELGFHSPGSRDALSAILIYSRQEATLHTVQPAGEREVEFALAYTEYTGGWRLYGIEGMIQKPGQAGIIDDPVLRGVFDAQNFQPDVTAAEAVAFLQNYDKLPRGHDPFMPLNQNEVRTHLENFKTMNEQNLDFLNNSLKYLGFEEKTAAVMDTKIRQGIPEFQVTAQHDHYNNSVFHTLHFKKSSETDMYFFNKYDAKLSNGKPEEDKTQTFYIKNGQGFTAKEAFNLLEGRAVFKELKNKEGEPYTAWSKLELDKEKDKNNNYPVRQFSNGWGYDLEKSVSRFPVRELNDTEQKTAMLKSLQKGNQQQVTIEKDGKQEKFYLEAVPALRTINIYDTQRREVKRDTLLKPELKVNKGKKQDNDQSQSEDQKQSKKKGRGRGI